MKVKKVSKQSKVSNKGLLHSVLKLVGLLIPLVLMYCIFIVKLPSEVSYSSVWATISSLSLSQNILLLLSGLLTIVVYGWTSATVLPGLSLRKGTQSAVSGQLTSVILPTPVDLAIRFNMYKSYGFSVDKSAVAVAVAGIARYFTVVAIPLLGLLAMVLSGNATENYVLWLVGGSVVFIFALWLMHLILSSKKSAKRVGLILQGIYNGLLKVIRRKSDKDIVGMTVDFGSRTKDVAVSHFKSISISNIAWGLASYVVLLLAVRFCGIDSSIMSASYVLLITGCMLLLNAFPITPGGIGVTESILLAFIPFPNAQVQAAFLSALFVYRVYTWLLPMPVGAIAYMTWRRQNKMVIK